MKEFAIVFVIGFVSLIRLINAEFELRYLMAENWLLRRSERTRYSIDCAVYSVIGFIVGHYIVGRML